jgi:hypothetical protein
MHDAYASRFPSMENAGWRSKAGVWGEVRRLVSPSFTEIRKIPAARSGSREGARATASSWLSRDQESCELQAAGKSLSLRSGPPSGETRCRVAARLGSPVVMGSVRPARAERTRRKAICRPSGDHAGNASSAGSVVRRRISEAPTILTQMS